jgi:hypothetical protein
LGIRDFRPGGGKHTINNFDEGARLGGVKTQSFDEGPGTGGGRGTYRTSHGDFPVAALRGTKTQPNSYKLHAGSRRDGEEYSASSQSIGNGKGIRAGLVILARQSCIPEGRSSAQFGLRPSRPGSHSREQMERAAGTPAEQPEEFHTNSGNDFVPISWNACGMEECAENDAVNLLER